MGASMGQIRTPSRSVRGVYATTKERESAVMTQDAPSLDAVIAECERLLADITPGEWQAEMSYDDGRHRIEVPRIDRMSPQVGLVGRWSDAEFIAAAPRLVRDLLRILEGREQGAHEERRAEGPGGEP